MEHLSNALFALFTKLDGDEILSWAGILKDEKHPHHEIKRLDSELEESQVMHLIRQLNMYNTVDQQSIVGQIIFSTWMKPDSDCTELKFFKESVFNILLHFGIKTIELKDDEPTCYYPQLLRWHQVTSMLGEDIFTTSYLASSDEISGIKRDYFDWPAFIEHNNKELNAVLDRPMADLHMHLKGSSFNFDLSWLSIVNSADTMKDKFSADENHKNAEWDPNLYNKVYKAAIIRLYLASRTKLIKTEVTEAEIVDCLVPCSMEDMTKLAKTLPDSYKDCIFSYQILLNRVKENKNKDESEFCKVDYIPINDYKGAGITNILSSERELLYRCFKFLLENENDDTLFSTFFYAYLAYKNEFRQALIQVNTDLGFQNFAFYEERKDDFIAKDNMKYLYRSAIESFLIKNKKRYLETRIGPKLTSKEDADKIKEILDAVKPEFNNRFNIIFHFIKERDNREDRLYRHKHLREQIKKQAFAIYEFRNEPKNWEDSPIPLAGHLVGIDAANSEIFCRPEVFAQAFRFLRHHRMNHGLKNRPEDLNITYHVGEDFYSVADGLRAVEEAMIFFNLQNGDRLGHCLALGTDVRKYYAKRYNTICANKQVLIDNAAWLHHKCKRIFGYTPLCYFLERVFHKLFSEIYKDDFSKNGRINYDKVNNEESEIRALDNIHDYYLSWLLRGNSPTFGADCALHPTSNIEKEWLHNSENNHEGTKIARQNQNALKLFDLYHSDAIIKKGSEESVVFEIPEEYRDDLFTLVEAIQEQLLTKIEKKRIAIECNPTSNYKIGDMARYDEHPILRFFNYGLKTPYPRHDIAVSINTDDQGVFATSLDREYSLIALAMDRLRSEEFDNSPRQIIEWLDKIRQMSVEQQFAPIYEKPKEQKSEQNNDINNKKE